MAPQAKKKFWRNKGKQGQQQGGRGKGGKSNKPSNSKPEMKFNTQMMGKSTTPFTIVKDHVIKQIQKSNWKHGYDVVLSLSGK